MKKEIKGVGEKGSNKLKNNILGKAAAIALGTATVFGMQGCSTGMDMDLENHNGTEAPISPEAPEENVKVAGPLQSINPAMLQDEAANIMQDNNEVLDNKIFNLGSMFRDKLRELEAAYGSDGRNASFQYQINELEYVKRVSELCSSSFLSNDPQTFYDKEKEKLTEVIQLILDKIPQDRSGDVDKMTVDLFRNSFYAYYNVRAVGEQVNILLPGIRGDHQFNGPVPKKSWDSHLDDVTVTAGKDFQNLDNLAAAINKISRNQVSQTFYGQLLNEVPFEVNSSTADTLQANLGVDMKKLLPQSRKFGFDEILDIANTLGHIDGNAEAGRLMGFDLVKNIARSMGTVSPNIEQER